MSKDIQFTPQGYAKLKRELEELKGPTRMAIAEAIREAKAHGDLKENAAYHEAKLNQTRLESRIAELDKALLLAKIVAMPKEGDIGAGLGSKIKLLDIEFEDEFTVTLVGSFEADSAKNLISVASPLGEALVGREVGQKVEVEAPAGKSTYKILEVS